MTPKRREIHVILFFNAGDKIDETLSYSIPTGQDAHCIARWRLLAPQGEFFEVPTELTLAMTGETIAVQFARDITTKFGKRGVIRVNPEYDAEGEDPEKGIEHYPYARSRDDAETRGAEILANYLDGIVKSHLADCDAARAAGGAPRSAQGFTKRALKLRGVQDPGEQYYNSLRNGGGGEGPKADPVVAALQAQNQMIIAMLTAVMQGKTVDAAALAKLGETPNAVGVNSGGEVVTSGIATGEIKKPISQENTYDTLKTQPKPKADRAKDAAKHLE